ncbi:ATP-dependent helicase [Salmonella enterica]|nr:superfamily I DNA/RNA helicase [Salmonella enterica]EHM9005066.1 ATP-dependent helicase [Salmonella enterica]EID3924288.1 ATP-dependent helicase [Salmonella enterica]EID7413009.1 ATP-dependent helicase [Salmonella enterica]EIL4708183.1 ATP-dependent helicase [Salmonella enterica]
MNTNWWRQQKQMDQFQREFINLPVGGNYFLSGPPGSGKTNMLLLRAEVTIGSGERNVLFITYTRSLADFIRSGAVSRGLIEPHQIKTFHSWACEYVLTNLHEKIEFNEGEFDETARAKFLEKLIDANKSRPSEFMYSAIFVDEAQDLTVEELDVLLELSEAVCICGDDRQGIYNRNGMEVEKARSFTCYSLDKHFRIGYEIAKAADRLMPPAKGIASLESTCNYDQSIFGQSTAEMHECKSREAQFELMLEKINLQLDAFNGDNIGIFCPKQEDREVLRSLFDKTDLTDLVYVHGVDDDASFVTERPIHVLTLHGSKGTEFRCVHIFGAESLAKFPLNRTKLSYTGITRAKTSLNVYRTGKTSTNLENAFAKKTLFNLDNLFKDDE